MKILITGATGLIGQELGLELARQGHELIVISRSRQKALLHVPFPCEIIEGDLSDKPIQHAALGSIDGVIHLLGEGVAEKRWNPEQKKKILDSRVVSTRNLIASLKKAPSVFVSASATGFYGNRGDEELTEDSKPGKDFLADVCISWENEVDQVKKLGNVRIVKGRIGVVLSSQGGALEKILPPFQASVGGALGSGRQWMSWVHIDDIVGLFSMAIKNEKAEGAINFVAPEPVSNNEFSRLLAKTLHRIKAPNVPKIVLKTMFGELAEALLASVRVLPVKAEKLGYKFKYQELESAFQSVLRAQSQGEQFLEAKQFIPKKREELFQFFAEAKNLEEITPALLKFRVIGMSTPQIQAGTLIDYQLKIRGIPMRWRTRIEDWSPPSGFVDTALKGPYRLWHHTHKFEDLGSGTLMTDCVRYVLPMGYFGRLTASSIVKNDVKSIFEFRRKRVAEIFGVK